MKYVSFALTHDDYAPAVVEIGSHSTPVWRQNRWESGEYAQYIRNNGCGHCCTAMAARLYGVDIDPYEEYMLCRKLWGAPNENGNPVQHHFMSVSGISKILKSFNIPAECFGTSGNEDEYVAQHIAQSLENGKQVIFWSHPSDSFPDNPFSKGEHYVMAAGFDESGKIVIANSSEKWTAEGIQLVDMDTIVRALYPDSAPSDMRWGEPEHFENCAGYVIVG